MSSADDYSSVKLVQKFTIKDSVWESLNESSTQQAIYLSILICSSVKTQASRPKSIVLSIYDLFISLPSDKSDILNDHFASPTSSILVLYKSSNFAF